METDPIDPVTVTTDDIGEQIIARVHPEALILRISLPMAVSFNGHAGAVDWIASASTNRATLYTDEIRTPTYGDCVSRLCEMMLAGTLNGIYHAGPTRLSLYQIAG